MENQQIENPLIIKDTGLNDDIIESSKNQADIRQVANNLSKRQIKKLKKAEKWMKSKFEKRLKERLKAKEKRAFKKANNIDLGPSRKELKKCTMADSGCKLNVTIDMSFDNLMIDKDIAKLIKQILRCYSLNRRASAPLQFSLTNLDGKSLDQLKKYNGYEHWDVKLSSESYVDLFPKNKIVYLTSESEKVIDEIDHSCLYVIGGLVDHNSQKGICHRTAISQDIQHARLPLDKFLNMKARKVLTVDHVFEIMLRVSEGKTWQEAFLQVLPERKNAQLKVNKDKSCNKDNAETKIIHNNSQTETTNLHISENVCNEEKNLLIQTH